VTDSRMVGVCLACVAHCGLRRSYKSASPDPAWRLSPSLRNSPPGGSRSRSRSDSGGSQSPGDWDSRWESGIFASSRDTYRDSPSLGGGSSLGFMGATSSSFQKDNRYGVNMGSGEGRLVSATKFSNRTLGRAANKLFTEPQSMGETHTTVTVNSGFPREPNIFTDEYDEFTSRPVPGKQVWTGTHDDDAPGAHAVVFQPGLMFSRDVSGPRTGAQLEHRSPNYGRVAQGRTLHPFQKNTSYEVRGEYFHCGGAPGQLSYSGAPQVRALNFQSPCPRAVLLNGLALDIACVALPVSCLCRCRRGKTSAAPRAA
jgi:hypothetical protein